MARFVQPMAANARDITNHQYFVNPPTTHVEGAVGAPLENFAYIEQHLKAEKRENPKRIPYVFFVILKGELYFIPGTC